MITLGILTRNRPEELQTCIVSSLDTAAEPDDLLIVLLFGDDMVGYKTHPHHPQIRRFLSTPRMFYYSDLRLLYQHMHEVGDLDLFVIANDDCEFMVGGWDKIAEEQLYENFDDGMGVVSFWQHPFHTFMSRAKLFDEQYDGILAPEDYVFYFGDSERHADLVERNQWVQSDIPLVKHPMDAVHSDPTRYPFCWFERDKHVYDGRMAQKRYVKGLENRLNDPFTP
ncbi:hypothetical protein LCGC14_2905360 [marine sediment metagenome]|uniref:Glycosyltransferase n=1 Tax=marine sediment metagenome TaxID=412755 RepID=A0A0F9AJC9_9ZZZZ